MKYIRTKEGMFEFEKLSGFSKTWLQYYPQEIINQADTIEELMMIGDLVFKKNGDVFVIPNQAHIDYYIKHKSISKLFIEDSKGNYIKVAEENEQGEQR